MEFLKGVRNTVVSVILAIVVVLIMRETDVKGWAILCAFFAYFASIFLFLCLMTRTYVAGTEEQINGYIFAFFVAGGLSFVITGLTYAIATREGSFIFLLAIAMLYVNSTFIFDLVRRDYEKQKRGQQQQ